MKETIYYKKKKIALPFKDADYSDEPLEEVSIANRFNGESVMLPRFAVAVYDVIIGSEMLQQWQDVRKGLDWFRKYFAKEYMVLLD